MESKILSWDEIVRQYPNRWVFLEDYTEGGYDIASARVVDSATANDLAKKYAKWRDSGRDVIRRSTVRNHVINIGYIETGVDCEV